MYSARVSQMNKDKYNKTASMTPKAASMTKTDYQKGISKLNNTGIRTQCATNSNSQLHSSRVSQAHLARPEAHQSNYIVSDYRHFMNKQKSLLTNLS